MKTFYLLIDYESVQPVSIVPLNGELLKVLVFIGPQQSRLPFELAMSLQHLGSRAEYIKISGSGPNALDFHIAFYIGQLAAREPAACFQIISKDAGFDPLIQHLKSKGIVADRLSSLDGSPLVKCIAKVPSVPPAERLALTLARLRAMKTSRPASVKTLSSTISWLFKHQLTATEIAALIQNLADEGHLQLTGTRITYSSPGDS